MRKILSAFLIVIALSCSCYANNVDNSVVNNINASTNMLHIDTTSRDKDGNTPLHLAVMAGENLDVDLIKNLIDHGADLNAKNNAGYTPFECVLFDRVTYGSLVPKQTQFEVMMLFLDNGVHFDVNTSRGEKIAKRMMQIMFSASPAAKKDPKIILPYKFW